MQIEISDDAARLDIALIHRFLTEESSWARGMPLATLHTAVAHSLCFGAYHDGSQVGFARVISDRATYAYLASSRADFLRQLGQSAEAADAYRTALSLTDNAVEVEFLSARLSETMRSADQPVEPTRSPRAEGQTGGTGALTRPSGP